MRNLFIHNWARASKTNIGPDRSLRIYFRNKCERFLLRFLHKPCVSSPCGYFPFKARICCSGVPAWGFDGGAPPVAWIIWVSVQVEIMEGQGSTSCPDLSLSDAIGAHAVRDDQTIRPANTIRGSFLVIGIDHLTCYLQNMLLKLLGIRSRKLYWSVRGGARSFVPLVVQLPD